MLTFASPFEFQCEKDLNFQAPLIVNTCIFMSIIKILSQIWQMATTNPHGSFTKICSHIQIINQALLSCSFFCPLVFSVVFRTKALASLVLPHTVWHTVFFTINVVANRSTVYLGYIKHTMNLQNF